MPNYQSKYITELTNQLSHATSQSEKEAIWAQVRTPIIEDLADQPDNCLATFIYQITPDITKNTAIYLYSSVTGLPCSENSKLLLIPNTDIAYLSLALPKTLRTTYTFLLLDSSSDFLQCGDDDQVQPNFYPAPMGSAKKADALFSKLMEHQKVKSDSHNKKEIIYHMDMGSDQVFHRESVLECPLAPHSGNTAYTWEFNRAEREQLKLEGRFIQDSFLFADTTLKDVPAYSNTTRNYWIYLPKDYNPHPETPYPLMFFLDGIAYAIPVPSILEKTHHACIAVFLDSADNRMQEYNCHSQFTEFLAHDFIEILHRKNKLPITRDPKLITITGSSASGLAAFYAAITHPHVFGNAISQSPSFEMKKPSELEKLIDETHYLNRDTHFILEVGTYETIPMELAFQDGSTQAISPFEATKHVFDMMKKHSMHVTCDEFIGGHNYVCWYTQLLDDIEKIFQYRHVSTTKNTFSRK